MQPSSYCRNGRHATGTTSIPGSGYLGSHLQLQSRIHSYVNKPTTVRTTYVEYRLRTRLKISVLCIDRSTNNRSIIAQLDVNSRRTTSTYSILQKTRSYALHSYFIIFISVLLFKQSLVTGEATAVKLLYDTAPVASGPVWIHGASFELDRSGR